MRLGIQVSPVPSSVLTKLKLSGGVIVTEIAQGSFAEEIGVAKRNNYVDQSKARCKDEASYNAIVDTLKSKDDVVFVVRNPRYAGNLRWWDIAISRLGRVTS